MGIFVLVACSTFFSCIAVVVNIWCEVFLRQILDCWCCGIYTAFTGFL